MSISSTLQSNFTWFKNRHQTGTPSRVKRSTHMSRDYTDGWKANEDLTKAFYFGEYPGLKLASALAMVPVKIPVFFQGIPTARTVSGNESADEVLETITHNIYSEIQKIHIQRRREGTIWVWPKFVRDLGRAVLEFIPDQSVSDIIRDLNTGEIIRLYTDEYITISTGFNIVKTVRRIRTYTKQRITVQYENAAGIEGLENRSMRNPIGMLPVPFSFEADGDDIRGHSVYSRILGDYKAYHDTDYAEADLLAKFRAKLLAGIKDPDEFARNNGYDDATDFFTNFDLQATDMILYLKDKEEKPELMEASQLVDGHEASLKRRFRKIIEGTGMPEILWGLKTEGNMASVEENMATLLMYIRGDQVECTNPWKKVFSGLLALESMVQMIDVDTSDIEITWNDLEAISDKTKSEVFKNFAQGIASIMNVASITKRQLYNIWKMNFPKATEEEFEEFEEQIWATAKFKQYRDANLIDAAGIDGDLPENPDEFGITP